MLILKISKAEVLANFRDGCSRRFGNSSACYEMGNCDSILMKVGKLF
jgi:hypothetical protein